MQNAKDDHSLSYVAQPVDGVWIIAMDICKYANNQILEKPETGGAFTSITYDWIKNQIIDGKEKGKYLSYLCVNLFLFLQIFDKRKWIGSINQIVFQNIVK